jgi:hypothetical protein
MKSSNSLGVQYPYIISKTLQRTMLVDPFLDSVHGKIINTLRNVAFLNYVLNEIFKNYLVFGLDPYAVLYSK